jgi:hypothetical protein
MSATEPGAKSSSCLDTGLVSSEASCFDFSIVVLGVLSGIDCGDVVFVLVDRRSLENHTYYIPISMEEVLGIVILEQQYCGTRSHRAVPNGYGSSEIRSLWMGTIAG